MFVKGTDEDFNLTEELAGMQAIKVEQLKKIYAAKELIARSPHTYSWGY